MSKIDEAFEAWNLGRGYAKSRQLIFRAGYLAALADVRAGMPKEARLPRDNWNDGWNGCVEAMSEHLAALSEPAP